jgi:activating signal cointegrator 1
MKVLTIRQPHVAAIFARLKLYETRSWRAKFRGLLAIHAGAAPDLRRLAEMGWTRDVWHTPRFWPKSVPIAVETLGAIIGTVEMVDCIPVEDVPDGPERDWGDFSAGRWAWKFEDPRLLSRPLPAVGALSLWNFDVPLGRGKR